VAGSGGSSGWAWVASIINASDTGPDYIAPTSGNPFGSLSGTAGTGVLYSPAACTVKSFSLHVIVQSAGGSDATTFTVRHNGADTSMTCTATGTTGTYSCSDATPAHTFSVAVDDTIEYKVTQTNSAPNLFYSTQLICQ
jgi:hypothetical protein